MPEMPNSPEQNPQESPTSSLPPKVLPTGLPSSRPLSMKRIKSRKPGFGPSPTLTRLSNDPSAPKKITLTHSKSMASLKTSRQVGRLSIGKRHSNANNAELTKAKTTRPVQLTHKTMKHSYTQKDLYERSSKGKLVHANTTKDLSRMANSPNLSKHRNTFRRIDTAEGGLLQFASRKGGGLDRGITTSRGSLIRDTEMKRKKSGGRATEMVRRKSSNRRVHKSDNKRRRSTNVPPPDAEEANQRNWDVGSRLFVFSNTKVWRRCKIRDVNEEKHMVKVHYEGFLDKWDEWIPKNSARISFEDPENFEDLLDDLTTPEKKEKRGSRKYELRVDEDTLRQGQLDIASFMDSDGRGSALFKGSAGPLARFHAKNNTTTSKGELALSEDDSDEEETTETDDESVEMEDVDLIKQQTRKSLMDMSNCFNNLFGDAPTLSPPEKNNQARGSYRNINVPITIEVPNNGSESDGSARDTEFSSDLLQLEESSDTIEGGGEFPASAHERMHGGGTLPGSHGDAIELVTSITPPGSPRNRAGSRPSKVVKSHMSLAKGDTWRHTVKRTVISSVARVTKVGKDEQPVKRLIRLECRGSNVVVQTITNVALHNFKHDGELEILPPGEEVEIKEFGFKNVEDTTLSIAPAIDRPTEGYLCLWKNAKQMVELTEETFDNGIIVFHKDETKAEKYKEWYLEDLFINMYEDGENALIFDLDEERFIVEFPTEVTFLSMFYILSSNRHLEKGERYHRIIAKYSEREDMNEVFERVVLTRTPPHKRDNFVDMPMDEKTKFILQYGSEEQRDYDDYLDDIGVSDEDTLADDIAMLHGWLYFASPDEVREFVIEMGLVRLREAVERESDSDHIWDIYEAALECYWAIMNKPADGEDVMGVVHLLLNCEVLFFIISNFDHPKIEVRGKVVQMLLVFLLISQDEHERNESLSLEYFHNVFQALTDYAIHHEQHSHWWIYVEELHKMVEEEDTDFDLHLAANIVFLINRILSNPNVTLIERIESRVMLEYLGFYDACQEVTDATDNRVQDDDMQELLQDFIEEVEMYTTGTQNDNEDMPDADNCYEHLCASTIDLGVDEQFSQCLKLLALIPEGAPGVWDQVVHQLECVIIRKEHNEDILQLSAQHKEELAAMEKKLEGVEKDFEGKLTGLKQRVKTLREEKENVKLEYENKIKNLELTLAKVSKENKKLSLMIDHLKKKTGTPILDPDLEKYQKMLKQNVPQNHVENMMQKDGVDPLRMSEILKYRKQLEEQEVQKAKPAGGDPELKDIMKMLQKKLKGAPLEWKNLKKEEVEFFQKVKGLLNTEESAAKGPSIDPKLEKYAKMLKMKIPKHAVVNKMRQDGIDESRLQEVEDFVAGKAPAAKPAAEEAPKPTIDPKLEKYVKMVKMKIPKHAVENKMRQDGIDVSRLAEVEDFIAGKVPAPKAPAEEPPKPTIDPKLAKYVKMVKMNIPKHAVENKMRQDGIDISRLTEVEDFIAGRVSKPKEPEVPAVPQIDEKLKKYVKMVKMNIPKHAVENKMRQDGIDASRFQEVQDFIDGKVSAPAPPAKPVLDDKLKKYLRMVKMNIPRHAVENKMKQDGINKERYQEIEDFIAGKVSKPAGAKPLPLAKPKLPEDLEKYYKMMKLNIPDNVIKNKMNVDGIGAGRFSEIVAFHTGVPAAAPVIIKELDPKLKKYKKMYDMNIPAHAVKNKMKQDGIDPARYAEIVSFATGKPMEGSAPKKVVKKVKVKPKPKPDETLKGSKFFKNVLRIDSSKLLMPDDIKMYTAKPIKKVTKTVKKKKKVPKFTCLVQDGKRLQNLNFLCAGLKRDKITHDQIVSTFWALSKPKFDIEAVLKVIPDDGEMYIFREYKEDVNKLDNGSKFLYHLRNIPKLKQRSETWMMSDAFDYKEANIKHQIDLVQQGCDIIRNSRGLRTMFKLITELLQTQSEVKYVYGFPLRSLYTVSKKKLNDGRTWLQALCHILEKRDHDVLLFVDELQVVKEADKWRDIASITQALDKLKREVKLVGNRIRGYKNIKVEEGYTDNFTKVFGDFVKLANPALDDLQESLKKLQESAGSLAEDFGYKKVDESGKNANTEYYPFISAFADEMQKALDANKKLVEMEKKKLRKEAEKKRKAALKEKKRKEREAKKKKSIEKKTPRRKKRRISDVGNIKMSPNNTLNLSAKVQSRRKQSISNMRLGGILDARGRAGSETLQVKDPKKAFRRMATNFAPTSHQRKKKGGSFSTIPDRSSPILGASKAVSDRSGEHLAAPEGRFKLQRSSTLLGQPPLLSKNNAFRRSATIMSSPEKQNHSRAMSQQPAGSNNLTAGKQMFKRSSTFLGGGATSFLSLGSQPPPLPSVEEIGKKDSKGRTRRRKVSALGLTQKELGALRASRRPRQGSILGGALKKPAKNKHRASLRMNTLEFTQRRSGDRRRSRAMSGFVGRQSEGLKLFDMSGLAALSEMPEEEEERPSLTVTTASVSGLVTE